MGVGVFGARPVSRRRAFDVTSDEAFAAFDALLEIGEAVQDDEVHLDEVLRLVVDKAYGLLGVDIAWIALFREETGQVEVVTSQGASCPGFDDMAVAMGSGLGGVALRERRTIVVDRYAEYGAGTPDLVHRTMLADGVTSVMCAPMLRGPAMVGALYAGNRAQTQFAPGSVSLLSAIATQASAAIRH